jgi:phosphate starvation-inducible protein PhoH and related proteins
VRKLKLREGVDLANLYGPQDLHLKMIENELDVRMTARGDEIMLDGQPESVQRAERILQELSTWTKGYYDLKPEDISRAIQSTQSPVDVPFRPFNPSNTQKPAKKWRVNPKTPNQQSYLEAIEQSDLVIAIGPAGTGKTYLAMAMALAALTQKEVSRIVLARPAVEAGEHLGFLPGDLFAKVHPYLRPLYDALYTMMDIERANRLLERGEIEIAPLAFMRGRTLDDAFVILDEAQNATTEQMKMFLTRLGLHSKAIVTGDITQIDLPDPQKSGLAQIADILVGIEGIQFVYFTDHDVIRHRLVKAIIKAYDLFDQQSGQPSSPKRSNRPASQDSSPPHTTNGKKPSA